MRDALRGCRRSRRVPLRRIVVVESPVPLHRSGREHQCAACRGVDRHVGISDLAVRALRLFASRIKKTVRFAEAPVQGMSVLKYDPDGTAAQSYRDLAKEVLAHGIR